MNRIWGFIGLISMGIGYCLVSASVISIDPNMTYIQGLIISPFLLIMSIYAGWVLSRRLRKQAYWKNFAAGVLLLVLAANLYQALLP